MFNFHRKKKPSETINNKPQNVDKARIQREKDERELKSLEKTVGGIAATVDALTTRLESFNPDNVAYVSELLAHSEQLRSLIRLYTENKFSLPSNEMSLLSADTGIRKNMLNLLDTSDKYARLANETTELHQKVINGETLTDAETKEFDKISEIVYGYIHNMKLAILNVCEYLKIVVMCTNYDIMRFTVEKDIISQYYKDLKNINNDNGDIIYTVRFVPSEDLKGKIKRKGNDNDIQKEKGNN